MYAKKLTIDEFRSFEAAHGPYSIDLGKNITCIAGHNGVGKTTVLAILSNCGELKIKDGTHLNGQPFRGDYAQLIKGDPDYDTTGEKSTIEFGEYDPEDVPGGRLSFRATFQNRRIKNQVYTAYDDDADSFYIEEIEETVKRYRLIPVKTEDRNHERKIKWPTFYLGLSRLYPIGESETLNETPMRLEPEVQESLVSAYKSILTINSEIETSSIVETPDAKKKKGAAIVTPDYGVLANSSGQDNLGQILLAVLSFECLKKRNPDDYRGGLLLIDELDATLHPSAQARLYDYLKEKSKTVGIQIVFTTHSLSLIRHMYRDGSINPKNHANRIVYFTNSRGRIETKVNPPIVYIENDLKLEYGKSTIKPATVPLLAEDPVARTFLRLILSRFGIEPMLKENEASISATEICKLVKAYPDYFYSSVIVLDGDMTSDSNRPDIQEILANSDFSFEEPMDRSSRRRILALPGSRALETELWDMMVRLDKGDRFYFDPDIEERQITKASFVEAAQYELRKTEKALDRHKIWFNQIPDTVKKIVINRWIDDNVEVCEIFTREFLKVYNEVGKLQGLAELKFPA